MLNKHFAYQVSPPDFYLLLGNITRYLHQLHAVEKRTRYTAQVIGSRYEHHS